MFKRVKSCIPPDKLKYFKKIKLEKYALIFSESKKVQDTICDE
jgi:hypothetical protein